MQSLKEQLYQANSEATQATACSVTAAKQLSQVQQRVSELESELAQSGKSQGLNRTHQQLELQLFEQKCETELRLVRLQMQHAETCINALQHFASMYVISFLTSHSLAL